jgi:hypothetical protein
MKITLLWEVKPYNLVERYTSLHVLTTQRVTIFVGAILYRVVQEIEEMLYRNNRRNEIQIKLVWNVAQLNGNLKGNISGREIVSDSGSLNPIVVPETVRAMTSEPNAPFPLASHQSHHTGHYTPFFLNTTSTVDCI